MNARHAYDQLKIAIDASVEKKNYLFAVEVAKQLGMSGGENDHPTRLADYDFSDSYDDGEVTLHFESYDSSKTFEMRPDVNRFSLELKSDGNRVENHNASYHD